MNETFPLSCIPQAITMGRPIQLGFLNSEGTHADAIGQGLEVLGSNGHCEDLLGELVHLSARKRPAKGAASDAAGQRNMIAAMWASAFAGHENNVIYYLVTGAKRPIKNWNRLAKR
jgi:hypothetical protein